MVKLVISDHDLLQSIRKRKRKERRRNCCKYCVLTEKMSIQVSRLIEMQTPLYLEGVRNLHPYFQRELCQESEINCASNLQ